MRTAEHLRMNICSVIPQNNLSTLVPDRCMSVAAHRLVRRAGSDEERHVRSVAIGVPYLRVRPYAVQHDLHHICKVRLRLRSSDESAMKSGLIGQVICKSYELHCHETPAKQLEWGSCCGRIGL